MGFVSAEALRELAKSLARSGYGEYLLRVIEERLL